VEKSSDLHIEKIWIKTWLNVMFLDNSSNDDSCYGFEQIAAQHAETMLQFLLTCSRSVFISQFAYTFSSKYVYLYIVIVF
jgi:hypothetical protein